MQELMIEASNRAEIGTASCRRMRRTGVVPGVVYGHGQLRHIALNFRDFNHLLHSMHAEHAVVKCKIESDELHVLIKDVQRNVVTHNITHVDLMIVDLDEMVVVEVPIETLGEPEGVKSHGGVLELLRRDVVVECKARDIPKSIKVDVSPLLIHQIVAVRDLPVLPGITYKVAGDVPLLTVAAPTLHVEQTAEEAAAASVAEPEVITAKKPEEGEEGAAEPGKKSDAGKKPAEKAEKKEKK